MYQSVYKLISHQSIYMSVNEKNSSVNLKLNSYILFTCLVAGLCVFTINYNFGVVNIPENYIHRCQDSDVQYRLGMSNCVPMTDYFWGYFAIDVVLRFGFRLEPFVGCYLYWSFVDFAPPKLLSFCLASLICFGSFLLESAF